MRPFGLWQDRAQEVVIKDVREGTVAQIVAEPRNTHIVDILLTDLQRRLLLCEFLHHFPCNVSCTNAMLEAVVNGCGEHVVYTPELFEIPQTLELFRINDIPTIDNVKP